MSDLREAISREVFAGIIDPQSKDTVVQSVMIADAILAIPAIAAWMTCDSDRPPEGENSRSEVECEAGQSGAESASPESCADAKVELVATLRRALDDQQENFSSEPVMLRPETVRAAITALEQSDAVLPLPSVGVPAAPSGHSAKPESVSPVSAAVAASVPNARSAR